MNRRVGFWSRPSVSNPQTETRHREIPTRIPQNYVPFPRKGGDRLPTRGAHNPGVFDATPFKDTALGRFIASYRDTAPVLSANVEDLHDRMLLPAIEEVRATEQQEWDLLRRENEAAEQHNRAIDVTMLDYQVDRDCRWEEAKQDLEAFAKQRFESLLRANAKVAAAGGTFGPDHLDKDCLPVQKRSLEAVYGEEGLVDPDTDADGAPPSWLSWFIGTISGIALGWNYFALPGMIRLDAILDEPWQLLVGTGLIGISISFAAGYATQFTTRWASQVLGLGRCRAMCVGAILVSTVLVLTIVGVHASVDYLGLMKLAAARNPSFLLGEDALKTGGSDMFYIVASLTLGGFYILYNAWLGVMKARTAGRNRVISIHERDVNALTQVHIARGDVREAHKETGEARIFQYEYARRLEQAKSEYNRATDYLKELEARKLPIRHRLSEEAANRIQEAANRIQEAVDQVVGNQRRRDTLVELLRAVFEGNPGAHRHRTGGL